MHVLTRSPAHQNHSIHSTLMFYWHDPQNTRASPGTPQPFRRSPISGSDDLPAIRWIVVVSAGPPCAGDARTSSQDFRACISVEFTGRSKSGGPAAQCASNPLTTDAVGGSSCTCFFRQRTVQLGNGNTKTTASTPVLWTQSPELRDSPSTPKLRSESQEVRETASTAEHRNGSPELLDSARTTRDDSCTLSWLPPELLPDNIFWHLAVFAFIVLL